MEQDHIKSDGENNIHPVFITFKQHLEQFPFITIIGKYDHVLGPRALFSSVKFDDDNFVRDLLRDALNTKNKFVILNYNKFYSQVCKVEIKDEDARGRKQLYAIILLRHSEYPLIPNIHFKRIEMIFRKLGDKKILTDNIDLFEQFYNEIHIIYMNKDEILPLESCNIKIRSGVNTIQGFCELILESKDNEGKLNSDMVVNYVKLMLDSCDDIVTAIEEHMQSSLK